MRERVRYRERERDIERKRETERERCIYIYIERNVFIGNSPSWITNIQRAKYKIQVN